MITVLIRVITKLFFPASSGVNGKKSFLHGFRVCNVADKLHQTKGSPMNIHEYQAKALLRSYGAPVSDGREVMGSSERKNVELVFS